MMRLAIPLIGLAVAIAMASPAAAAWTAKDYAAVGGIYQASGVTEDKHASLAIVCHIDSHDLFEVTLWTGDPYDPKRSYSDKVPISVTTDGRQQPVVYGSFKNFNGNLAVRSETSFSGPLAKILGAMAASKSTIKVQVDQREYRFSPEGLTAAMRFLKKNCP